MVSVLNLVDAEITGLIGQPWTQLKQQNNTFVARHTLLVVAMVVRDPLFAEMTPEKQNILKWAALMHDISKLSIPAIEGRDHVHPFKSSIAVLDLF